MSTSRPSTFLAGMVLGAGLLATGLFLGGAGQDDSTAPEVIRAQRFEVVDDIGTVQLALGAHAEGGTLSVRDRFGKTLMVLSATEHGAVLVINNAESARPAVMAGASATGGAFQVYDLDGTRVIDALARRTGGEITIATSSRGGAPGQAGPVRSARPALKLGVDETGAARLDAFGSTGDRLVTLSADAGGGGVIETFRGAERPLVAISSTVAGQGQVKTLGGTDQPLVLLTASAANQGQLYTFDENGSPMVALATRTEGPSVRVYGTAGNPAVTLETNDEGNGLVGVWRGDGSGQTFTP